jgi:transaldolase
MTQTSNPTTSSAPVADTAGPLARMARTTSTRLWNDSATVAELSAAIGWGAVGATCNPVIALTALKSDAARWHARAAHYARQWPTATESQIAWQLVRDLSTEAAALLEPAFRAHRGRDGRLSIQTDPRLYRDTDALVAQAVEFSGLAPNMIVKIPAVAQGIAAIEEATYRGVSINATVSFTVPQALAVGQAVERGLRRREADGGDVSSMGPVCTIMVGRLDDWLKAVAERDRITVDPGYLEWVGVAVFKKAYQIFRERGYRARLLSAAFRNHMHWSQLIGGDVVISPPFDWQLRFNASGIEPLSRIDDPVAARVVEELYARFADFRRAYDEDGMSEAEFEGYGATRRTLRQFLGACAELELFVRDATLADPGVRRG